MTQFLYSRSCQSLGVAPKESGVNTTSDSKGAAAGGGQSTTFFGEKFLFS